MARRKIQGTAFHEDTDNVTMLTTNGADVYCYEAGSTSVPPSTVQAVNMYDAETGGSLLWPGGAGVQTDSVGYFEFWVDYDDDIRIIIEKIGVPTLTRDYVAIPVSEINLDIDGGSF